MRGGYGKFKNKIYRGAFFKALLLSLSIALLACAAVLLLGKLNLIVDSLTLALIVGGVGFAAAAVISLSLMLPRAKRIAELIDGELNFRERVQTMDAFRGQSGSIIELQRKDTEARLRKIPLDWYSVKKIWVYAIVLACALALCSFAYAVPDMFEPPEPVTEEPFELSEWQELALENLIEYVEQSALRDGAKLRVLDELRTLLDSLRLTDTVKKMKTLVVGTIVDVNSVIDRANSYDELYAVLKRANADGMAELAAVIGEEGKPPSDAVFDALTAVFADASLEELYSLLLAFGGEIGLTLTTLSLSDDPLAAALESLSGGAFDIVDEIYSYDDDTAQVAVSELFARFRGSLGAALDEMAKNAEIGAYAIAQLMDIFGISASELPPEADDILPSGPSEGDGGSGNDDEPNQGDSGGFGSGDTLYGSDDEIYYPDEERYAKYGEVINEYYAKITEKILSGELSEETVANLEKYFESLYDGAAKEED